MTRPVAERREVLAAEDNEMHRLVLGRVMRDALAAGAPVLRFVRNGRELLDRPGDAPRPDIVLLDLHMPVLSGFEALPMIRADARLRPLPVVVMSSSTEARHVDAAYREGANSYLVKEGDYRRLLAQTGRLAEFWFGTALLPSGRAR